MATHTSGQGSTTSDPFLQVLHIYGYTDSGMGTGATWCPQAGSGFHITTLPGQALKNDIQAEGSQDPFLQGTGGSPLVVSSPVL